MHVTSLQSLPLPLNSVGIDCDVTADQLAEAVREPMGTHMTWGLDGDHQCRTQYSFVDLGGVALMIGRTSPVACTYSLDDSQILVGVNYAGRSSFRDGLSLTSIDTRQILAYPGTHGRLSTHYCAGINFRLDRAHL